MYIPLLPFLRLDVADLIKLYMACNIYLYIETKGRGVTESYRN